VSEAEDVARAVEPAFVTYPHWARSGPQESSVRVALYKALKDTSVREKMVEIVDDILKVLRRDTHE